MKKKVLLIDGNAFCYRAFYAIRRLSTSKGQPTNAVYGFVTMLNKLMAEHRPDYAGVAFDLKGPTFRHKRFANYKISRKPMPDQLSVQLPVIKKILAAYKMPIFEQKGYEADDIIASLANRLKKEELEIFIITGDKDILQTVNDHTKVINPHKDNLVLDKDWVKERFGVEPKRIVEIMALAGDSSDNIPGVPGIGWTQAMELIKRFGSLNEVLANVDKITSKGQAERIKRFSQQARMSRELASLDFNIAQIFRREPQDLLKQLKVEEADNKDLFEIFKELEFNSLAQKVASGVQEKIDYKIASTPEEAKKYLKSLLPEKDLALYLAVSDQDPMLAKISGIAFASKEGEALFVSLKEASLDVLKPVLESRDIRKIGHNLKYMQVVLSAYGIKLQGVDFDTMLASYLLQPERARQRLIDLVLEYLNYKLEDGPILDTIKEKAKACSQNVNAILRLSNILQNKLKQQGLLDLFKNVEMPLIEVLADMEQEGVSLDRKFLLGLSGDFKKRLANLTKDIYQLAGEDFNINSPKQLSLILFEKLKLPKIKRTKTGSSTNTEVLQKLKLVHPIASSLLEFRAVSKLKSTYVDGLIKLLHPRTGRLHTSFNQTTTATGRLSSSRPNLQNIPIRTDLGKRIRQAFVAARAGHFLLSADYSQIELRILAHLSGDKNLISAFKKDLDIHAYTASLIFAVSPDKVSSQMRDTAKTVNFGIIYGMSAYGLSKDLGIKLNEAQEFIGAYFTRYAGVKRYTEQQIRQAETKGFVATLMRRRRYIPEMKSKDENLRQFAQRAAINAPVQGSASDLIKAAMVAIHQNLKSKDFAGKMIIQVHDELVFSVPGKELSEFKSLVQDKMENVVKLKVPIKVSIKTGKNWLELK